MRWWPYHDGHHLLQGIDLLELFNEYGSARCLNIIDALIVEDSLRDNESDGLIIKARATLNKHHGRINKGTDDSTELAGPIEYADQTDDGYVGIGIQPVG